MTDLPDHFSESSSSDDHGSTGSGRASYLKTCSQCEQLVRMVQSGDGTWRSLEPEGGNSSSGRPHDCGSVPKISRDWSLQALGHPLTCRLDCWWCSEEVYLHTDGNGTFTLFDALSWPWPTHECWHQRSEERDRALLKVESDLRASGYRGRGRLIGLMPASVPSSIPPQGRKNPPVLQIHLSSTDHQMVDRAVHQITQFVAEHHHRTPVPVPLPVGKNDAEEKAGKNTSGKQANPSHAGTNHAGTNHTDTNGAPGSSGSFIQHVHHRAIEMWTAGPSLIAQLGQVQLPEAVDVIIRQASR